MLKSKCLGSIGLRCRRFISTINNCLASEELNFVNGTRVAGSGENIEVLNPANGDKLSEFASFTRDNVRDHLIQLSHAHKVNWSAVCGTDRAHILRKTANVVQDNVDLITELEVLDTGKAIWEVRADIKACVDTLNYYASIAQSIKGSHMSLSNGNFAYTIREPLGLVCGIGSFNFPFQMAVWKSAAALACGNSIVFKPSHLTPFSALLLAECYEEAGLPDGCYNVVQGAADTGQALTSFEDFAKISFTGSVETGKKVMADCAKDLKKVTLELGGKSPLIIFEDCNMDNAVKGAMLANFLAQGQVCSNGTRIFVQKSIHDEFVKKFVARTAKMRMGDPFDEDVTIGAMISKEQADKVMEHIEGAKKQGITVAYGGYRFTPEPRLMGGHYIRPAILTHCLDHHDVAQQEIFGSVACVMTFDTEQEVVQWANDTPFGLAGGVFTSDLNKAHRVVKNIEAGVLYVNTYNAYPPELPFGGYKHSGMGRENGEAVIEYFTQLKSVFVEMGDVDSGKL